jgi:mono/diheme cytochrome c family protein
MKHSLSLAFLILMLLLSCSRKSGFTQTSSAGSDSVKAGDISNAEQAIAVSIHLTYEQRQGKILYLKYCSVCHGIEGKGDGFNSYSLDPKPKDLSNVLYMKSFTDGRLLETIRFGGRGVNRSPIMPSWGGRLTNDELMYVVAYVKTFTVNNNATNN